MSEKKEYNAFEVAQYIADKMRDILAKSEITLETLQKAKNTAHEIEAGKEPQNDEAECPESLGSEGSKKQKAPKIEGEQKSESSEDSDMEDQPLSDFEDESEEDESEEDESEEDEEEYEFKKSESGMYTVEYKRLNKSYGKKPMKKMFGMTSSSTSGGTPPPAPAPGTSIADQIGFGKNSKDLVGQMVEHAKAGKKTGIPLVDAQIADAKGEKRMATPAEKDSVKKLAEKKKDKKPKETEPMAASERVPVTMPKDRDRGDIKSPMGKDEDGKINPSFDREKKDVEWTKDQKKEIDRTKPGKTPSRRKDQSKFIEEAKKRRQQYREEGLIRSEHSVKETKGIDLDKERDSDKTKEEKKGIKRPLEKCGQMTKAQMEKCGEVKGVNKLKKFLGKEKKPSPGMVKEPQE